MLFTSSVIHWLEIILEERFGHPFRLAMRNEDLVLSLPGVAGNIIFDTVDSLFHQSLASLPCAEWDSAVEGWFPVLGKPLPAPAVTCLKIPLVESKEGDLVVHYDVLGLTYWMFSRLEEVSAQHLDEHGRFPASSSHAYRHGYLERPIVDEWLHILGQIMVRQWPGIELKQHNFSIKVSHDVDLPSRYAFQTPLGLIRAMGGDVLKRHSFKSAAMGPLIRMSSRAHLHPQDPENTFDWIMGLSEYYGLTSAFYFICGRTDQFLDAQYEPEHPAIRSLLKKIHERGHEIGLHPSYNTYLDPNAINGESQRLKRVCEEEGISQAHWGGRMHYLRWSQPKTMQGWELAKMSYDSTLGYADYAGFRCGTCFEFPAFDPVRGEVLNLRIRPLVAMDCTIMADRYMGLGNGQAAADKLIELKRICHAVQGNFTLLWHNNQLGSNAEKELYNEVLCA